MLGVLLLALDDRRDSGYVPGFVGGCAPSIAIFFDIVLAEPELIVTAVLNRFPGPAMLLVGLSFFNALAYLLFPPPSASLDPYYRW